MTHYNRIMLGKGSMHAATCFEGGFLGVDFDALIDLASHLQQDKSAFNRWYWTMIRERVPDKKKGSANAQGASLYRVTREIPIGTVVLAPDGSGRYRIGTITSDYHHAPGEILPHRRRVEWQERWIDRNHMSEPLQNAAGSILTDASLDGHADEIERLLGGEPTPAILVDGAVVEDPTMFAMESHLEEFLVKNWDQTELGRAYDIFTTDDGEVVGQQFPADGRTRMDILALSKDQKRFLVIELKKGRSSDEVVGQTLRYMGYVQEEVADEDQSVEGAIIALEDDHRMRRALTQVPHVRFYRYRVDFRLEQS